MNPNREHTLFAQALDLDPEKRAGFLDCECGGDADLRARLEVLLAANEVTTAFLPPQARTITRKTDNSPGEVLG